MPASADALAGSVHASAIAPAAVPTLTVVPIATTVPITALRIISADHQRSGRRDDRSPARAVIGAAVAIGATMPTRAAALSGIRGGDGSQHRADTKRSQKDPLHKRSSITGPAKRRRTSL